MLLPLIVLAAGAFFSFQSVIRAFDQVVQEASGEMNLAARLQVLIRRTRIVAHDSFIPGFGNEDERATFLEASRQVDKAFQEARAEVFDLEEERTLIQSAHADWQRGRSIGETLLGIPNPARNPRAGRQLERLDALLDRALDKLERVHSLAMWEMGRHLEQAREVRRRVLLVMVVVFVVGL